MCINFIILIFFIFKNLLRGKKGGSKIERESGRKGKREREGKRDRGKKGERDRQRDFENENKVISTGSLPKCPK